MDHVQWLEDAIAADPALEGNRRAMLSQLRSAHKLSLREADEVIETHRLRSTAPTIESLILVLREESAKRAKATTALRVGVIACATVLFTVEFLLYLKNGHFDGFPVLSIVFLCMTIAAGASSRLRASLKAAVPLHDPRSIGPLLDILDTKDVALVKIAKESIGETLRLVTAHDHVSLDPRLLQLLLTEEDPELVIAIVAAFRKFGDASSIEPVERLAEGKGAVPKKERERMTVLSRMALADIRMRSAQVIISKSLPPVEEPQSLQQGQP